MILKNLRQQKNWSQEQLAQLSGLSLRTIQRIEGGNKASLESLKSLAAVFQIEVSVLEQEIIVIDKSSDRWKQNPLLVRFWFLGSNLIKHRKRDVLVLELISLGSATIFFLLGFFYAEPADAGFIQTLGVIALYSAYGMTITSRLGDKYSIW